MSGVHVARRWRPKHITPDVAVPGVYGPAVALDSLGNTDMGAGSNWQSYRFRAAATSTLVSARVYIIAPIPGYAQGSAHTVRWGVYADDGTASHLPTGAALATQDQTETPGTSVVDRLITFASPPSLTSGTLYHLVAENRAASPATTYISLDGIYAKDSPAQPRWPSPELTWLYAGALAGPWTERTDHRPIVGLTYGSGATQGQSYMEVSYGSDAVVISGDNMGRERFTVSGGDRLVTGAAVRPYRLSGSDPLTVRLEQSDGTLIDSFTLAAALFPTRTAGTWEPMDWVSGSFAATRTLTNGTTYSLRFSCPATSEYRFNPMRSGETNYSYPTANDAVFADGDGEESTNAGGAWSSAGRVPANRNNLQCYFVTTT